MFVSLSVSVLPVCVCHKTQSKVLLILKYQSSASLGPLESLSKIKHHVW